MRITSPSLEYVVCVTNEGGADLEFGKLYPVRHDARAAKDGLLRVVDASGEDYLYPRRFFAPVQAPKNLKKILAACKVMT